MCGGIRRHHGYTRPQCGCGTGDFLDIRRKGNGFCCGYGTCWGNSADRVPIWIACRPLEPWPSAARAAHVHCVPSRRMQGQRFQIASVDASGPTSFSNA